jgi:hypothetical protein
MRLLIAEPHSFDEVSVLRTQLALRTEKVIEVDVDFVPIGQDVLGQLGRV